MLWEGGRAGGREGGREIDENSSAPTEEERGNEGGREGRRDLPNGQGTRHLTRALVGGLHETRPAPGGDIDRLLRVILHVVINNGVRLVRGRATSLEMITGDPCVGTGLCEFVPGLHGPLGEALGELGHLERGGREGGKMYKTITLT